LILPPLILRMLLRVDFLRFVLIFPILVLVEALGVAAETVLGGEVDVGAGGARLGVVGGARSAVVFSVAALRFDSATDTDFVLV
jgi:hypothetical protein